MRAFVTSIGEPTTELCVWTLERNGFDVVLVKDQKSLWSKLKYIYNEVYEDFIRVDADVVVNKNLTVENLKKAAVDLWWVQFLTYDWFKQDTTHGGVQYIKREAIPHLREHIDEAEGLDRPESYMYRIAPFHNPRRCDWNSTIMGLNGYKNDIKRVMKVKANRGQSHLYDFELAVRIGEL